MNNNFTQHPAFQAALIQRGTVFRKRAQTELRLPRADEVGRQLTTWVKDGNGIRAEVENVVTADKIIARNQTPNCEPGGELWTSQPEARYNQWLIERADAEKIYGAEAIASLGMEFSAHRSTRAIRAVELTARLATELGSTDGYLRFQVTWSRKPMVAKTGDWLTEGGYSIGQSEMARSYEEQGVRHGMAGPR